MNKIEAVLKKYPLVVLDGAFGTEIDRRGFDTNDELWAARALFEEPELVRAVHKDYYLAGADVGTSASYQASVEGFQKKGFTTSEARGLISASVRLVREARDEAVREISFVSRPQPLVAGSIGPYGAYLADGSEYTGDYKLTRRELRDFHEERLALLYDEHPDIFACETIPLLEEALALVELLTKYDEASAWISFSCMDGQHISSGEPIRECAELLEKSDKVSAIGINCTAPEYVSELIGEVAAVTSKPVVIYPNTGEVYDAVTKAWHGAPQPYQTLVEEWYAAGARLIGGCCGTKPQDIEGIDALRARLMA